MGFHITSSIAILIISLSSISGKNLNLFTLFLFLFVIIFLVFLKKDVLSRITALFYLAFIYFVLYEGSFDNYVIIKTWGTESYNLASKLVISGFALFILGFSSIKNNIHDISNQKSFVILLNRHIHLILFIVYIIYLFFAFQKGVDYYTLGRTLGYGYKQYVIRSPTKSLLHYFLMFFNMLLPSVLVYVYYRLKQYPIKYVLIPTIPIFLLILLSGSRYSLIVSFLGVIMVAKNISKISLKHLFQGILITIFIFFLTSAQIANREKGFNQFNYDSVSTTIDEYGFVKSEGTVKTLSMMVKYFKTREHFYGTSTFQIIFFWIPRALWNSKPYTADYKIARDMSLFQNNAITTTASSFFGDFYADFGILGGLFSCFVYGVLAKLIVFKLIKNIDFSFHPLNVLSGVFIGLFLFSMRSFVVPIIAITGISVLYYFFQFFLVKVIIVSENKPFELSYKYKNYFIIKEIYPKKKNPSHSEII